jgi:hypothetical protein
MLLQDHDRNMWTVPSHMRGGDMEEREFHDTDDEPLWDNHGDEAEGEEHMHHAVAGTAKWFKLHADFAIYHTRDPQYTAPTIRQVAYGLLKEKRECNMPDATFDRFCKFVHIILPPGNHFPRCASLPPEPGATELVGAVRALLHMVSPDVSEICYFTGH